MISGNDHFDDVQQHCQVFMAQSTDAKQEYHKIYKTLGIDGTTVER